MLAWARQERGYTLDPVAKRLNVKPGRLLAWERGESKPTVHQAQSLAKLYHRPFGVFFLPQPPVLPSLAAEYRRLPGVRPGVESPESGLALRLMSQRRELALGLTEELGVDLFRTCRALLAEGVRKMHPGYDDNEIRHAVIRLMLPEGLFLKAYPSATQILP